jgi:hypothetical protein
MRHWPPEERREATTRLAVVLSLAIGAGHLALATYERLSDENRNRVERPELDRIRQELRSDHHDMMETTRREISMACYCCARAGGKNE